jgi:hypothetical protein
MEKWSIGEGIQRHQNQYSSNPILQHSGQLNSIKNIDWKLLDKSHGD